MFLWLSQQALKLNMKVELLQQLRNIDRLLQYSYSPYVKIYQINQTNCLEFPFSLSTSNPLTILSFCQYPRF